MAGSAEACRPSSVLGHETFNSMMGIASTWSKAAATSTYSPTEPAATEPITRVGTRAADQGLLCQRKRSSPRLARPIALIIPAFASRMRSAS